MIGHITHYVIIGNKQIGTNKPVFIIAEAGVNYNNKLPLAYKMIDIAAKAGADAIKFQTFKADNIQLKNSIKPHYQKLIKNTNYYNLIKKLETSFEDQIKLFNYCKKKKIIFLSTPYDKQSLDFLTQINVPAFKISSSDATNHLFLELVLKKRKPILLSTGLTTRKDVESTIKLVEKFKMKKKLVLFQTNSDYPTKNEDVNLKVIPDYMKRYKCLVGFSDHTQDIIASLGAVAMGACIIEKHFTISKNLSGPDQKSSLEPLELKEWIKKIRVLEKSLGNKNKTITNSEKKNLTMRKILVINPAKKDTIISRKLLSAKRGDGKGILPLQKNVNKILGKKLVKNVYQERKFTWDLI
ncbi:Pseudaminic acid synthase protein [Marine Group I thaumarchaeote SCGC AAA799-P11]|uniref:Pseudaminic acid synthase protein n=1 Tax=Marine Group I thaumarchaeote SCGC AAA799-P11 TaxID=1502295 RepID=A0A087S309_9ARCH|nr:Pseudaminic acid synthase protein [Marine Group I thaumarchaeote SCGC AAA799-P11]